MSDKRLVVLTGASRGLGRAMTRGLARAGHTVLGCSRSTESILSLLDEFGPPHSFDVVDVANDVQVRDWSVSILAEHGPPDLLVNNAAAINENSPLWEVDVEDFSRTIDTNIKGVFHTIRHFVPAMVERGTGVVVNFSSYWGRGTAAEVAPYCATKWAVEGMTRALADELPSGMAAVPFNPGVIHTEMLESCFGSSAASYPSPAEWAVAAVPFVLQLGPSDNGQPVTVPGF